MKVLENKAFALVEVTQKERAELARKLTMTNTYTKEVVPLYREFVTDNHMGIILDGTECDRTSILHIPTGLVTQPIDSKAKPNLTQIKFCSTLRPAQEQMKAKFLEHLKTHNGGIIRAETGTGKTVLALSIAAELGLKTLVIVPTAFLMSQWINRIKTFTDVQEVGIVRQHICHTAFPITVGMIHTLAKDKYAINDHFDLVIWDECHKVAAPTFSETAKMFWTKYRMGLSATPRRKDGLENVFMYHIGDIIQADIRQDLVPKVIRLHYHGGSHKGCVFNGELNLGMYATRAAGSSARNALIINYILKAVKKNRAILVLSDRIAQLTHMRDQIIFDYDLRDTQRSHGMLTGKQKYGLDQKLILGTYGCAGLGADLTHLDTVFFATPRVDVEQAVGRILRAPTGREPIVVEVIDNGSHIMKKWAKAREKFYRSKGMQIIDVNKAD